MPKRRRPTHVPRPTPVQNPFVPRRRYHSIMDCEEGLRVIAYFRRIADEDERNGRPKSAKALRNVALAMECVDYGLYQ